MRNLREMSEKIKNKRNVYLIGGLVILLLAVLWILPIENRLSIIVEYERKGDNDLYDAQLFWDTGDGYTEQESSRKFIKNNRVELEIRADIQNVKTLRIDPAHRAGRIAITSLQVKNHGIGVQMVPMREIWDRAQFYQAGETEVTRGVLSMMPADNMLNITLGEDMVADYFRSCGIRFKAVISFWIAVGGILLMLGSVYGESVKKAVSYLTERYYPITNVILFVGLFLIGYMAFNSFDYAHPDEDVSKAAVDYYVEHWKPADVRSVDAIDSISVYGHSRLREKTVYYFLAGKVAWAAKNILGLNKYYRAFNVLLFAIMAGIYCKKGKQNGYLFLMLGLTPQVWYIFSYATSDAWDYFLSFLILYQLTTADSMFHKAMETAFSGKTVARLFLLSGIFGLLFLGKKNYYFVFVASFLLLLFRLLFKYEKRRGEILLRYGIILCVCLSLYGGASLADNIRMEKSRVQAELRLAENGTGQRVEDELEKAALAREALRGVNMRERGVSLKEIFTEYGFAKYSYQSYTGTYGWMEYASPFIYYILIGGMYIIVLAGLCIYAAWEKEYTVKVQIGLLLLLNLAVFGASVWHSWTSDLQPQGRYLFAVNFIVAMCAYLVRKSFCTKRIVRLAVCVAGVLSVYSFVFGGIVNLI